MFGHHHQTRFCETRRNSQRPNPYEESQGWSVGAGELD